MTKFKSFVKKTALTAVCTIAAVTVMAQVNECGSGNDPKWTKKLKETNQAWMNFYARKITAVNVPFQLHIAYNNDSTGNITLQQAYNEIDSLNFFYANANMQLVECQAPDLIYDDSLCDFENTNDQSLMLTQHYTPGIINIYIHGVVERNGTVVCGYAPYPPSQDYLFINSSCAANGSTLAHELGHYFGLMHTHGGSSDELVDGSNCSSEGDLICDTPADPTLSSSIVNSSCVYTGTAVDANSMPYAPDVNNIMSYSRKQCRNSFTTEQYALMDFIYQTERNYLACLIAGSADQAAFSSFSIFPNPGRESLYINLRGNAQETVIMIFDLTGKLVLSQSFIGENNLLNTSALKNGMYFYAVKSSDLSFSGKWIKQD